jgi:hypothetical protein
MVTPPLDRRLYEKRDREVTFIIETSGFMGRQPFAQAKKAD